MTRLMILKNFLFKSVLPILTAIALYYIFKPACMKDSVVDYLMLWICCGLPFCWNGISLSHIPGGTMGGGLAMFALQFALAGAVGGCFLIWKIIMAISYIPVTVNRLIKKE